MSSILTRSHHPLSSGYDWEKEQGPQMRVHGPRQEQASPSRRDSLTSGPKGQSHHWHGRRGSFVRLPLAHRSHGVRGQQASQGLYQQGVGTDRRMDPLQGGMGDTDCEEQQDHKGTPAQRHRKPSEAAALNQQPLPRQGPHGASFPPRHGLPR